MLPRINIIAMVILCMSIIVCACIFALNSGGKKVNNEIDINTLILKLDDEDPDIRTLAEKQLQDIKDDAKPYLEEASKSDNPNIRERARKILKYFTDVKPFPEP